MIFLHLDFSGHWLKGVARGWTSFLSCNMGQILQDRHLVNEWDTAGEHGVPWVWHEWTLLLSSLTAALQVTPRYQLPEMWKKKKKKLCSMWVPLLWPPIQDISVTSAVAEFALGLRLIKAFKEPSIRSQERKLPAFRLVNLHRADGQGTLVA